MTKFFQLSEPVIGSNRQLTPSHRIKVQREPEGRHRLADHRQRQRKAVGEAIGPHRRQHTQRNGEQECEDDRRRAERHGDGQPRENHLRNRLAQRIRTPEIPAQGAGEPIEILDGDGPVEAVELANRLDVGGTCALAGDGNRRIARNVDHREGDQRDRQRHQQRDTQPLGEANASMNGLGGHAPFSRKGSDPCWCLAIRRRRCWRGV